MKLQADRKKLTELAKLGETYSELQKLLILVYSFSTPNRTVNWIQTKWA